VRDTKFFSPRGKKTTYPETASSFDWLAGAKQVKGVKGKEGLKTEIDKLSGEEIGASRQSFCQLLSQRGSTGRAQRRSRNSREGN